MPIGACAIVATQKSEVREQPGHLLGIEERALSVKGAGDLSPYKENRCLAKEKNWLDLWVSTPAGGR